MAHKRKKVSLKMLSDAIKQIENCKEIIEGKNEDLQEILEGDFFDSPTDESIDQNKIFENVEAVCKEIENTFKIIRNSLYEKTAE